ncbi:MAG: Ig-like domain-containing protein, partial [Arenicellales bacterium]|nr:Ig-like domain-containing protein [Arenicellales bacterium]
MTATFSESVIVDNASGTPTLTLVVGSTNRTATYASGSGSTSLVFQYTIQAGETDSDGISIGANALTLNSGTIRDAAGNGATLTHSAVSANSSYMVDTTGPTAPSVSGTTPTTDQTPTWSWNSGGGGNGTYRYKLDSTDLTSGATQTTDTSYTPGDNISTGTHVLYVQERDAVGNWSSSGSSTIVINTTAPSVNRVAISSATGSQNSLLNAGDVVSVTATFSEVVNTTGTPQLTLAVGSDNRTATYASGSGSTSLVFQFTIQAGDNDTDGISIGADALALDNGTISDPAGNNAILTHSAMSDNNSYKVDTTAPTVNSFTISDSLLTVGETATVDLVFSEAVFGFASAADITDPSGSLAAMTSSDNITWTGTFTPNANTEEASNRLSLATSWTDLAGNGGPSETTPNYAIDTLLPTISSVTSGWGTFLNATEDNSSGTVTVLTSGAENGQTVTVALNGTNYPGTVSDNSTSVTFDATGLQDLTDGSSYTLTTNVSDAAGNAATVNTGTSFTYDITAPTISGDVAITSATGIQNNLLNAGDNVSVTVTFSESVIVDNASGTPTLTLVVGS